ncbi:cell division protein SepF [Anaerococcus vaginimassiliensis]|uniref:cell division protein SepF n=1 Tax=Anaerococcus vaginimassiliensis TaxID=2042308 RepID=UPI00102F8191|nr:cell division protein SepF [Anaerococcus vaginimassiliensis]
MLDRFKEFIGIDDKYDDYDEDQLYFDDDVEENEVKDDVKEEKKETYGSFFSDNSYTSEEKTSTYKPSFSDSYTSDDSSTFKSSKTSRRGDNVVSMSKQNFSGSNSMRISIQEPLDYETDGPKIIDDILNNKVVVLNLEMVNSDLRRQIFDFVSGAVYALNGSVEKVTKGIFVISPSGVQVDSSVTEQISEGNYNQL